MKKGKNKPVCSPTILIVEDEMIVAKDIERTLMNLGYQVSSTVSSGKQVIKKAKTDKPDLILMDIVLRGEMNGIEAAEQIHTRLNIPVVYLTAYADKKTLQRAKITEPYGYILKPFSERELHSTIEIALHECQMEKKIKHLSDVLCAIRNVNQLITKEKNRDKLLKGICKKLTETRGYSSTWIAVIDESGKPSAYAETGVGRNFSHLIESLKQGNPPKCWKKILSKPGVVVIEDTSKICAECPLARKNSGNRILSARLESNNKVHGLIIVSTADNFPIDKDELSLLNEIAGDVGLALHTIKIGEERKQALKQLEESEARLRTIISKNADSIIIVDGNGIVRFINPAAEKLFGFGKKKMVGELFGFPVVVGETTEIEIIQKGRKTTVAEMRMVGIKWQGKAVHLASLRDITEHKQTEQALQLSLERSQRILQETVSALAIALEKRDPYTAGHSLRVAQLTFEIATQLGFSEKQIRGVHMAASIHDIGKIYVPAEILSKPNKLTEGEFMLIKSHCQVGYDILKNIEFPWPIAKIVLQHHERIDGSGYPMGLKDKKILHEAKILGVADVVEAMCSHRPYRPAPGIDKALEEILQNKGVLYNPDVVDACFYLFKGKGFTFGPISRFPFLDKS